jgi:hypothetical protein
MGCSPKRGMLSLGLATCVMAALLLSPPANADTFTFTKNKFKFDEPPSATATDFHIKLSVGTFSGTPSAETFVNTAVLEDKTRADFAGGTLNGGGEINVKSVIETPAGQRPMLDACFTESLNPLACVGSHPKSKGIEAFTIGFLPPGDGRDFVVTLFNDFSSTLTGSLQVFSNSGFSDHFNVDEADELRNASLIAPVPAFVLAPGEALAGIEVHLASLDEYVLVLGSADAADGLGAASFALAVSPGAAIPEPSTFLLLTLGLAALAKTQRRGSG